MTNNLFEDIYSNEFNLVKLDIKYLNDMWEYSSDSRMYEHFEFGPQRNIKDCEKYLSRLINRSNGVNAYWWFIQINNIKKIVGSFGVHDIDLDKKSCEISYALSPNFWGKGVFHKVLKLVLHRLINNFQFHRITAVTSSKNIRSIEALKKVGFKVEGEFRDFYLNDNGIRYNATSLGLLASEYI